MIENIDYQLLRAVLKSFKWKLSTEMMAKMANSSVEEYSNTKKKVLEYMRNNQLTLEEMEERFLKQPVSITPLITSSDVHVDLENYTMRRETTSDNEPSSPKEIITLLNIDTKEWKLSQYWAKQVGDKWKISALIKKLDKQENINNNISLEKILDSTPVLEYKHIALSKCDENNEDVVGVLSLQDLHFGKPGNEEMDLELELAVMNLAYKANKLFNVKDLIFVIGGDALNVDNFNSTTTKGTFVEQSEDPTRAYIKCFNAYSRAIALLRNHCETLHVVYIPGNHDRMLSFTLSHALSKYFSEHPDVKFDVEYSERKVKVFGKNMFCIEHGDVVNKNNALIYATEFPQEWGLTRYRTLYLGHWHKKKTLEFVSENEQHGFITKYLPSLSATDYWHYHNKFTGNTKAGIIELHSYESGKVGEFTYTVV